MRSHGHMRLHYVIYKCVNMQVDFSQSVYHLWKQFRRFGRDGGAPEALQGPPGGPPGAIGGHDRLQLKVTTLLRELQTFSTYTPSGVTNLLHLLLRTDAIIAGRFTVCGFECMSLASASMDKSSPSMLQSCAVYTMLCPETYLHTPCIPC